MPRKKKDGRFINYYIDRRIFERLECYAADRGQPMTAALEQILEEYLSRYEAEQSALERYCPGCHVLVRGSRCPECGSRWLEPPAQADFCRLTERELLWAGVLEDCFRQNDIPYIAQNVKGAGFTARAGTMLETTKFYVRYGWLDKARALEEQLFAGETEDTQC